MAALRCHLFPVLRMMTCLSIVSQAKATQQQQQPFNGLFSRITWVSRYQKGKTNLDFTGARDSEWQWHQLGHMQVCTSLQTDNHASTPPLCFLQAGCPSCRPTNSVKALKARKGDSSRVLFKMTHQGATPYHEICSNRQCSRRRQTRPPARYSYSY